MPPTRPRIADPGTEGDLAASASSPADGDLPSCALSAVAAGARPVLAEMNPGGGARAAACGGGHADLGRVDGVCHPCHGPRRDEVCANIVDGGARRGAKPRRCRVEGCDNWAQRGGVCVRHGAKPIRCRVEGCDKGARGAQGICFRHGAKVKTCRVEGCNKKAQVGGVCIRHGAKVKRKTCSVVGCSKQAHVGGVCVRHGAKVKRCSVMGCTNHVEKGGVCLRHGAKKKRCSVEGCTKYAQRGGVCYRHRAKEAKTSGVEGSIGRARIGGVPAGHAADGSPGDGARGGPGAGGPEDVGGEGAAPAPEYDSDELLGAAIYQTIMRGRKGAARAANCAEQA